ncbi:LPXTG cell wall anchor domain-containing protein [Microbacterium sp. GXF7504]
MRRSDRHPLAGAALVVGAVAAMLSTAPAAATTGVPDLSYSLDGTTWSSSPPASLLPSGWIAVPGASQRATLHLRAERPGATLVAVFAAPAVAEDPDVIDALRVTGSGDRDVAVDGSVACSALAPQTVLQRGEAMQVPIEVALAPELTDGENVTVSLDILVALSDTGAVPLPNGCPVDPAVIPLLAGPDTGSAGILASTGSDLPMLLGAASIAALLGGAFAVRRRRRHT